MSALEIIAVVLIAAGWIFLAIGACGVIRFPDFYTRLHAAGVGDSFGAMLMTVGMVLLTGLHLLSVKILLFDLFILLTNPLGTNLIIIGAIRANNYQGYNNKKIAIRSEKPMEIVVDPSGGAALPAESADPEEEQGGEEDAGNDH